MITIRRMSDELKENYHQPPEEGKQESSRATPSAVESCLGLNVNFPRNEKKKGE